MTAAEVTEIRRAKSPDETVGFFAGKDASLFGILTRPVTDPLGAAVVILPGGGRPLATNRNGFSVRLTRELAGLGFHGMRFDYHGCGDSTGEAKVFKLHDPFPEDLEAAVGWVRLHGVDRQVLMGSCFGARAALWVAASDPNVVGAVLVAMPVRDLERGERIPTRLARDRGVMEYVRKGFRAETLRGALDPDRRRAYGRLARAKWETMASRRRGDDAYRNRYELSETVMRQLETVVARRVPVLFVFGEDDDLYEEFQRAGRERLGPLIESAGPLVEVATVPGHVHGYVSLDVQDRTADVVRGWLERRWTSR